MTHRTAAAFAFILLGCTLEAWSAAPSFVLVRDGRPAATIVIAAAPSAQAGAAAEELRAYIEKISGARLPIAMDGRAPSGPLVLVRRGARGGGARVACDRPFDGRRILGGPLGAAREPRGARGPL